jgi:hypothetical protein
MGQDHSEDLGGADGRVTLKWILKNEMERRWLD